MAGTMGDGREIGKWLGRAVLGDSGSVKGGIGEVALEITMVGRVGGGDRGVGTGRGSGEGQYGKARNWSTAASSCSK